MISLDGAQASEPASADVRRRYPQWQPYYGSPDQLCHARRAGTADDVHGDCWQDVIDKIQRVEARIAVQAWQAWACLGLRPEIRSAASELPPGSRVLAFLDGTELIVPEDTCRGCLMNEMEDQLPNLLHPVFDDGTITVRQDAEWAVPGFMVVGIRPHIGSLDQMDTVLAARIMEVTRVVRAGMRQMLGLQVVQMYQEEKLTRAHFHLWMLPLWPDVMMEYDMNPRIYESNIMEYISKFDLARSEHMVRDCAARLRSHLTKILVPATPNRDRTCA